MKQTHRHMVLGMSLGMCMGTGIGVALGTAMSGGIGTGMCLGLCFGMSVGMALGALRDREINRQIEEKGYTVREIVTLETGDAAVTVEDKTGALRTVTVPAKEAKQMELSVGSVVFLGETDHLEVVVSENDL